MFAFGFKVKCKHLFMLKFRYVYVGSVAGLFLCGCSPRIVTDITKKYPVNTDPASVRVYALADSVPTYADVIGRVAVLDGGACKFSYEEAIGHAQNATASAGGNGFAVLDHVKPSIWGSAANQISGYMLFLNDSLSQDARNQVAELRREVVMEKQRIRAPRHTFSINAGYAYIWSKIENLDPSITGNPRNQAGWMLNYDWTSKRNFGLGAFYGGFKGGYDYLSYNVSVIQQYTGGKMLLKNKLGEKWVLDQEVGFGYVGYSEKTNGFKYSESGFGSHVAMGVSYLIRKNMGLGLNVGVMATTLSKIETESEANRGISQFYVNCGYRYYF